MSITELEPQYTDDVNDPQAQAEWDQWLWSTYPQLRRELFPERV